MLQRINDNVNPGDDQLKFQGVFDLAAGESFASFDPSLTGVRVLLLNQFGGTELDVALPGGTYHGAGTRGWKANGSRTRWKYADKTTDGMLTTAYAGIYEVQVSDRDRRTPREVQVKVAGRFGTYPVVTTKNGFGGRNEHRPPAFDAWLRTYLFLLRVKPPPARNARHSCILADTLNRRMCGLIA